MLNGKMGERIACDYLRKKKYNLLDFNYRTRFGEIDLVFEKRERFKKSYLVFVEVKLRNASAIAKPKEFVDYSKQQKIIMAAEEYIVKNKCNQQPRFDVVEIIYENNDVISINHLENAFTIS